jgi:hypothetical protein
MIAVSGCLWKATAPPELGPAIAPGLPSRRAGRGQARVLVSLAGILTAREGRW